MQVYAVIYEAYTHSKEIYPNVKSIMNWFYMYRKPCICSGYLLAVLKRPILEKISANQTCLTSVNIYVPMNCNHVIIMSCRWLIILRRSEMQMFSVFFFNKRIEMEGKQ